MDKIRLRDLQRWPFKDLVKVLPIAITHDSQSVMVLLTLKDYNKLVKKALNRYDSQSREGLLYDPEKLLAPVVIDADGNLIPDNN